MKSLTLFLAGLFTVAAFTTCAAQTKSFFGPIKDPVYKVQPPAQRRDPVKENLFVLIEDPGGKTGAMTVGNKEGSQTITQPGLASEVKDAATPPAHPARMDEKKIKRIFGAALSALPQSPVTFTLYFKNGSTDFTEEYAKSFPSVLAEVDGRESKEIIVVGHADRVGTRQKNNELSRNRAERVKDIFVSRGIDPDAIEIEWHGEDDPLIKTRDEVAEPRNRRAAVTVR
jgi:outer membrane protein OmpA-like peptidoglycan-associated protein